MTDVDALALREAVAAAHRHASAARAVSALTEDARNARASGDVDRAVRLLVEAVQPAYGAFGPERAIAVARESVALLTGAETAVATLARARLGDALSWAGRYEEALEAWREAVSVPPEATLERLLERASVLLRLGRIDEGRDAAYGAAEEARRLDDRSALLDALGLVVVGDTEAGRLREALRASEDGLSLAAEPGIDRLDALGCVAWLEALLGLEAACRSHLAEAAELVESLRITAPGGFAHGLLELSLGNHAEAARLFQAKAAESRVPASVSAFRLRRFADALVEALVRAGRRDDAATVLAGWYQAAVDSGQPRLASLAYRCRGLVEDDLVSFERALAAHESWSNPFERARTELCYGEALRRRKRRQDARARLRDASEHFEHVGARVWRARALAELAATGERARRRAPETTAQLTPQERHVARLAASGLTTKDIAAQLVLSPKTIETHLRHVFQKLGVRSRTELAAQFRDLPDSSTADSS